MKKVIRKIKPILGVYHYFYAFAGALFNGFPSRKIKVYGVTGTNGKTTTVDFTAKILKEAGFKVAAFSSARFEINGKEEPNLYKMTMPGRAVLQKLLKRAVSEGCDIAILEVTSEGIKQFRHKFINFKGVCFTNLSPEHIESHGGFENYKKEKGKLFRDVKGKHFVNIDDENADYFLSFESKEKIYFGIEKKIKEKNGKNIFAKDIKGFIDRVEFELFGENYVLSVPGKFNVYNALCAIAIAKSEGVDSATARKALSKTKVVPGRMEEVVSDPFRVIVDYAVTPVTLEGVYKEIKETYSSDIICVLGACGGGRDKWKRPVLGEVAAKYCKRVIVTNEDPYDEDPEVIIDGIIEGTKRKGEKVVDRREAIRTALESAKKGDTVIVTGKGNEPWMCLANGKKIPWNEKEIIKEELKKVL